MPAAQFDDAACAGQHPDWWFPQVGGDTGLKAKRICWQCPARIDCLNWALDHHEKYGIWGGYSPEQRSAETRRRRRIAAAGRT